jgi:CheY-like chemotaxis protein
MDIHMPVMNGIEAMRLIREIDPEVPILVVTADVFKETKEQFVKYCSDYLSKPVNEEFQSKIKSLLSVEQEAIPNVKPGSERQNFFKVNVDSTKQDFIFDILIVDDNKINLKTLNLTLKQVNSNFSIWEASNGAEAVAIAKERSFDVVFMDLYMPKMRGDQASNEIKRIDSKEEIVLISADATIDRDKIDTSGIDHYVTKPFTNDQLSTVLQSISSKITLWENTVENVGTEFPPEFYMESRKEI